MIIILSIYQYVQSELTNKNPINNRNNKPLEKRNEKEISNSKFM